MCLFSHADKKTEKEKEVWLKPRASPLPLKRRGLRRAKARYCQRHEWDQPQAVGPEMIRATEEPIATKRSATDETGIPGPIRSSRSQATGCHRRAWRR
jgi:hypothetical protein